jgi:hypothetical protein
MSDTYSVIPAPVHRPPCPTCLGDGYIEVEECTCDHPQRPVLHDPMCGVEPCPDGCSDVWLPP